MFEFIDFIKEIWDFALEVLHDAGFISFALYWVFIIFLIPICLIVLPFYCFNEWSKTWFGGD